MLSVRHWTVLTLTNNSDVRGNPCGGKIQFFTTQTKTISYTLLGLSNIKTQDYLHDFAKVLNFVQLSLPHQFKGM